MQANEFGWDVINLLILYYLMGILIINNILSNYLFAYEDWIVYHIAHDKTSNFYITMLSYL